MSLLSFIIPCYNSGLFLDYAILSIYEQKNLCLPFEVVCCNDGSSDDTEKILNKYKTIHSNFRYYNHDMNLGGSESRNICVLNSKGDLIFCLDSDNILAENSINSLINFMYEKKCHACGFHKIHYFYDDKTYSHTWRMYHNKDWICDKNCLIKTNKHFPSSGNYLYTRELFDSVNGYSENMGAQDTLDFGFKHLVKGFNIAVCPKTYYWHRLHDKSYWILGQNSGENQMRCKKIYEKISEMFEVKYEDILKRLF